MDDTFTFEGADGAKIFTYRWRPKGATRGVLQIAHGMGEHALRYREPLQPLLDAGIAIYANDHRGHGKTSPDALGDFGPGGFAALVDDMAILSRRIRTENPGKKLILMGHSMGSFAAQIYIAKHSDLKVIDRTQLRAIPPPLLVTNITMLEYMLVRAEDQPLGSRATGRVDSTLARSLSRRRLPLARRS